MILVIFAFRVVISGLPLWLLVARSLNAKAVVLIEIFRRDVIKILN